MSWCRPCLAERLDAAEADLGSVSADYDRRGERLWRLAAKARLDDLEAEVARLTRERDEAEAREQDAAWARTRAFNTLDRLTAAKAEALARVRRALDDELQNLADDGARLSHSVVRRIEAALSTPIRPARPEGDGDE